jgi:hypothetical protein
MAPMVILTQIVFEIRVYGSPSLRAFIGRVQEGRGNSEGGLCSSTSRDVCELYDYGDIARVFGHPKILEVINISPMEQRENNIRVSRIYLKEETRDCGIRKAEKKARA